MAVVFNAHATPNGVGITQIRRQLFPYAACCNRILVVKDDEKSVMLCPTCKIQYPRAESKGTYVPINYKLEISGYLADAKTWVAAWTGTKYIDFTMVITWEDDGKGEE